MAEYENIDNNELFAFDSPKNQSSFIKVIGVGGGGGNAVNHMFRQGIKGVDFIVCNTDEKALNSSPVPNKIKLGNGLGAGSKPERAKRAAEEKVDEIKEALSHNTQMLFITAGMGGGTGTGAAPVIAEAAKSIKLDDEDTPEILVVAIVTMPFTFEGRRRREQAEKGVEELRKHVDSVLVIENDKLLSDSLPITKAYAMVDDVLLTAAKGIAEIITVNAYVNIDFQDVNTVMAKSGTALMGVGTASGEDRAIQAIQQAATSRLLNDNDIRGAKDILLYFAFSSDCEATTTELSEITDYISSLTQSCDTNVIWGQGVDDTLGDALKVTMIATGFDVKENKGKRIVLDDKMTPVNTPSTSPVNAAAPSINEMINHSLNEVHKNYDDIDDQPITTEPVDAMQQTTASCERRVFQLYPEAEEVPATIAEEGEKIPEPITFDFNNETQNDDGIRLITHDDEKVQDPSLEVFDSMPEAEPSNENPFIEPVAQPSAQPVTQTIVESPVAAPAPQQQIGEMFDIERKERIRRMRELLMQPNGVEAIENMTTEQLAGNVIPTAAPLSERESANTVMGSDGTIKDANNFLYDLVD